MFRAVIGRRTLHVALALVTAVAVLPLWAGDAGAETQIEDIEDIEEIAPPPASEDPTSPDEGLLPDVLEPGDRAADGADPAQRYHNLGSQLSTLAVAADVRQYGAGEGLPDTDMTEGAKPPTMPGGANSTLSLSEPMLLTIQLDGNQDGVLAFLAEHGITPANVGSDYLEAAVPPTLLAQLADQIGVARVRELPTPHRLRDRITSGGLSLHQAGRWHLAGYEGHGVKIGVIDTVSRPKRSDGSRGWRKDGFVGLRRLMGTELPQTVRGMCFPAAGVATYDLVNCDSPDGRDNHGTRVAETLMDIAPEASLYVSNASTWADLQRAVVWMHAQGVKVIVYSIGWTFHGNADGTSPLSPSPLNTVKWAADNGIVWVNAAGNQAHVGWYGAFADSDGDGYHEWWKRGDVVDEGQSFTLRAKSEFTIFMRWDDTWGAATKDLDLELRYRRSASAAWEVVAVSADTQNGGSADHPYEGFIFEGEPGQYAVFVKKRAGSAAPSWLQFRIWSKHFSAEHATAGGSISTPGDSASSGMLAVGAANAWNPTPLADYSSRGPTPDGRIKPDIVAVTCGLVTSGANSWISFCGTSAAAPHLGGLAALVLERNPTYTPAQVADYLKANAVDRGSRGPDNEWGHGFAVLPATGLPAVLPAVDCVTYLAGNGTVQGKWYGVCESSRVGSFSHFYNFSLAERRVVTIDLESSQHFSFLYLRRGLGQRTGSWLFYDSSGGDPWARINRSLPAGDYTIEGTTLRPNRAGPFLLTVAGLATDAPTEGTQISVTAGAPIVEGASARFVIAADPAPAAPLSVSLEVTDWGAFAANGATGRQTVTIPTSGSVRHSVATVDDNVGELDGAITAKLIPGGGYMVSSTQGAATVAVADNEPVVSITGDADRITEGETVTFTVSVTPAPSAPLAVTLKIAQQGYYAAPGATGTRTVTIPTAGSGRLSSSALLTVATVDDDAGEADGAITATLQSGPGYRTPLTVSGTMTGVGATVAVADNDRPSGDHCMHELAGPGKVSGEWTAACLTARGNSIASAEYYSFRLDQQSRVTIDLRGERSGNSDTYLYLRKGFGERSAGQVARNDDGRSRPGVHHLSALLEVTLAAGDYTIEATTYGSRVRGSFTLEVSGIPQQTPRTPQTPEVSVSGAAGVTEGAGAVFTVTAAPAPSTPLTVSLTVTQQGDYAAAGAPGTKTVTISTSGSVTHTVATVDDSADEADGGITATLSAGQGYTVSSSRGVHTVSVSDDDVPEVSVTAGADIDEGGSASFTITADPAPHTPLPVSLAVTQQGDYAGAGATGTKTVTVPTSGSVTHTVATTDDSADEADGSVTVTLKAGSGYTVSSAQRVATVGVSDDDAPPATTPEVSVTAGAGITEGGNAGFTITASPAPASPLSVSVTVTQTGDFAASGTTGGQTVTVPVSGSVSHTVATTDDSTDEADGSVTVTLKAGNGYAVSSSQGTASVAVADDDAPPPAPACVTADAALLAQVLAKTQDPWNGARPDLLDTFTRAYNTMLGADTYTVADLKARPDRQESNWQGDGPNALWQKVYAELDRLQACRAAPATPEISVTAGPGVTEGAAATFTITAAPAPSASLTVTLTVTQQGDYGASTGTKTVAVPAGGAKSYTVATAGDSTDEADGSVTVTLKAGSGYTVSSSQGAATVAVADDDDPPPPPPPPPPDPEVSVTAGAGVTEGQNASFTVTASPAPASPLSVSVTVTQTGDYGASTGTKTVTVPAGGARSYTVATAGDSIDEADGSVTVTVNAGSGYTVSSSRGTATVAVADDDDPPPPPPPATPEISVSAGAGVTEGGAAAFTVTAAPAPASPLTVSLTVTQTGDFGVSTGAKSVTISAGGSKSYTVATAGDSTDEADGSVTVTVNTGSGYTVSSSHGDATADIADDDATTVTLAASAGGAIAEDGGTREITLTLGRTLATGEALTAPLAVSGAAAGSHYTLALKQGQDVNQHITLVTEDPHSAQNPAVVFAAGSQQATLLLTALSNADTDERTVRVAFGTGAKAPTGQNLAGGITTTGSPVDTAVTNDDQPPADLPAITIDDRWAAAHEDTGAISFVVVLSEPSTQTVTVDYRTREGTAYEYLDYAGERGRLVFRPGTTRRSINVVPRADSRRESDETLYLVLSNPTGATIEDGTSTGTIIDDD